MSRTHGSKDFWLTALRADAGAFRNAVSEPGVLEARVPSCPEWTVGDLVRHLGGFYRRTHRRIGSGSVDQPWGRLEVPEDAPGPTDPGLVRWFEGEFAQLDAVLDALDPDLPAWNWAPQPKTASFWFRRSAHETAVHRWDAQLATGLPEPIETKLAGDTVAEVVDTFIPAGRRRGRTDVVGLVQLIAADLGHEWYLRLRGGGVAILDTGTLLDDDAHPARAVARGTASDLALAMWGRIAFEVLETAGDEELLDALRVS